MLRRIVHWLGGGCSPWTRDPGTASGTDASPGHVCPLWTGSLSCYQPWCPAPARITKKQLMVAWICFSLILWYYDAFASQIFKVQRHEVWNYRQFVPRALRSKQKRQQILKFLKNILAKYKYMQFLHPNHCKKYVHDKMYNFQTSLNHFYRL